MIFVACSNCVAPVPGLRPASSMPCSRASTPMIACAARLRFHASSTGRWAGSRFQPQNLKKPETNDLDAAVDAVMAGDMARIRELGAPLTVAGDIARGIICAAPGHVLIGGDFSAIESRVLAWLADEKWKLETYRQYDETGNPEFEPYCVMASKALRRTVTPDDEAGRGIRQDLRSSIRLRRRRRRLAQVRFERHLFRRRDRRLQARLSRSTIRQHFGSGIGSSAHAHRCVRTGKRTELDNRSSFDMEDGTLFMTLPSGRRLAYPEACLVPGKFEDTSALRYKDNAKGGWTDVDTWYGTLVENAVQATARDLLGRRHAAAREPPATRSCSPCTTKSSPRCRRVWQRRGIPRLMIELPEWADGLPIAAKVWTRKRYAKSKNKPKPIVPNVAVDSSPTVPGRACRLIRRQRDRRGRRRTIETTVSAARPDRRSARRRQRCAARSTTTPRRACRSIPTTITASSATRTVIRSIG